ncbi:thioredoxin domain-containing protein 15 [Carassius gibelio]|uniref:thioredoxin domain-containing protein 15 n=1 Tax=Carassius gibelio TaxID=101364 RepID=UPI00227741BD|nr:thioredoxin domain-containing protein 15 [Carassius gibelio]
MCSAPDRLRGVAVWLIIAGLVRLSHGGAVDPEPVEQVSGEACAEGRCETETEPLLSAVLHSDPGDIPSLTDTESRSPRVTCDRRSITERSTVQILNASQDLMELLNASSTECSLVLFYTTWCQFSANLAPHFNTLPRVFPSMHFVALDASQHSSLSTRFGTVAVPNILLFQGAKPMARFNQTERTLETLSSFITNQTGLEASPDQTVLEEGPLPAVPVRGIDWLFVFSVLFLSGFGLYALLCSDSVLRLVPDHVHQD